MDRVGELHIVEEAACWERKFIDKQCASYQVQVLDFLTVTVEIGVDYQ